MLRLACLVAVVSLAGGVVVDATATTKTYVSTPLGRMRSDCVHTVPSGSTLKENAQGRLDVLDITGAYVRTLPKCLGQDAHPLFDPATPKRAARTVLTEDGFKSMPKKAMTQTHASTPVKQGLPCSSCGCACGSGEGSLMCHECCDGCDPTDGALAVNDPPVFPADYDGWEAYTAWHDPKGIDTFLGNFSVPDAPQATPDILYIFTGLQNIDWIPVRDPNPDGFDIIQPVLQFPGDNGQYWSIKSWYVTLDDGAISSDELPIQTGDNVFGNMTQTGNSSWFIGSTVSSTQQTTVVNVDRPRLAGQFWAYNTLECYGCVDCTTYPQQPCKFSELVLLKDGEQLEPQWILNPKPNPNLKCHETIDILSPEAQNIVFQ